jgi:hypothetical protein
VAGLLGGAAAPAHAGPDAEVASAFDPGDGADLHLTLDYQLTVRRAAIKREYAGFEGTAADDPMPIVKDLVYAGTRHTLTPRAELGIFTDLSLSVAMPIVLGDSRRLKFDQRSTPCVFPTPGGPAPTCIDASNSSTVSDGLLPATGFDADDPDGPGFTDASDPTIFRGPTRRGLDQLHLGVTWAPMNQQRDDTKPTWKLGAEVRLPLSKPMKFDRDDPDGTTGVSSGLYEIHLATSVAKRLAWAEPYVELWWRAPFASKASAAFQPLEQDFGQIRTSAQQHAGTRFGFAAIAWDRPADEQLVAVDLSARFEAAFEGRGYSEMWEIFQYAGDAASGGPLVLDGDPTAPGRQALSHPGVSNIENYLTFAGRVGVAAELGSKVRLGGYFELVHDQSHVISCADAGIDATDDANDVVDPGTAEVNPFHIQAIDVVGHRYFLDEATSYVFLVDARVLF